VRRREYRPFAHTMIDFSKSTTIFVLFAVFAVAFLSYWVLAGGVSSPFTSSVAVLDEQSTTNSSLPLSSYFTSTSSAMGDITSVVSNDISSQFVLQLGSVASASSSATSTAALIDSIDPNVVGTNPDALKNLTPDAAGILTKNQQVADKLSLVPDSQQTRDAYWQAYNEVVLAGSVAFNSSDVTNALQAALQGNGDALSALVSQYRSIGQKLSSLRTPVSLADFHASNIRFFSNVATVFDAILHTQSDPLRAYIALEYFSTLGSDWDSIGSFLVKSFPTS